ncbi:hypothetical protein [Burkholderia latens]|uniref:hypothetical protein n=1 Tax=Burkholderia latens TaxID=488446 RepID=UPI001AE6C02E|nr:hypothetical protein [Burkholderia latens]MBR7964658.1 hypothetical protein [Burkholderia vietnamiensis]QTO45293.1 hypothetical protein J8I85_22885 [Burkholderia latens]
MSFASYRADHLIELGSINVKDMKAAQEEAARRIATISPPLRTDSDRDFLLQELGSRAQNGALDHWTYMAYGDALKAGSTWVTRSSLNRQVEEGVLNHQMRMFNI